MSGLTLPELARVLDVPISELRSNADRLREAADALDRAADYLDAKAANGRKPLKGREIIERLSEVVDPGEELHYTAAFDRLLAAGYVPRGKEPRNTLLAALGRSPYFTSIGSRTGRFRRNEPVEPAPKDPTPPKNGRSG